jgi:hypothetical protein
MTLSVRALNWLWFLAAYGVACAALVLTTPGAPGSSLLVEAVGFVLPIAVPAFVAQAAGRRAHAVPRVRQHWTLGLALLLAVGLVQARRHLL